MTKLVKFLTAFAGVAAVWIVVAAGAPVMAQTADGLTPSDETICDDQVGKAFGFCNAYCEAMDCDSDEANASDTACLKVRDKFFEATDGGELPCESSGEPVTASCPCSVFTDGSLASKGLIELWTASVIEDNCGSLSKESCAALFVCNYSTTSGKTEITLGATGTLFFPWYTKWTLTVTPDKCEAWVNHEYGLANAFPPFAVSQKRRFAGNPEQAWFENLFQTTQAEVDACEANVPQIKDAIAETMAELLGFPFTCEEVP